MPPAAAAAAALSSGAKLQAWCPGNYHLDRLTLSVFVFLLGFCLSAVCFLLFFVFMRPGGGQGRAFYRFSFFTSLHPWINICEETCFNAWHHFGPRWRVCVLTGEKSGPTGLDIRLKPQRARHNQQSRRCIIRLFFFFFWPASSSLTCWPRPPCLTGEVCQEVFWSVFRGVTGA